MNKHQSAGMLIAILLIMVLVCLSTGCGQVYVVSHEEDPKVWEGDWKTEQWGKLYLFQEGNKVTGEYEHDNGKLVGAVSGGTLTGTWSEAPSYSPPDDAGDVELTMSPGGNSFTGRWRYGSSGDWDGTWNGVRIR